MAATGWRNWCDHHPGLGPPMFSPHLPVHSLRVQEATVRYTERLESASPQPKAGDWNFKSVEEYTKGEDQVPDPPPLPLQWFPEGTQL